MERSPGVALKPEPATFSRTVALLLVTMKVPVLGSGPGLKGITSVKRRVPRLREGRRRPEPLLFGSATIILPTPVRR